MSDAVLETSQGLFRSPGRCDFLRLLKSRSGRETEKALGGLQNRIGHLAARPSA